MEKKEIATILEELRSNPDAVKNITGSKTVSTREEAAAIWSKAASGLGYSITAEEISSFILETETEMKQKARENANAIESLSDEKLEAVAGGKGHDKCEFSFLDRENCWFTDACDNAIIYYGGYLCHKFFKDSCKSFMA